MFLFNLLSQVTERWSDSYATKNLLPPTYCQLTMSFSSQEMDNTSGHLFHHRDEAVVYHLSEEATGQLVMGYWLEGPNWLYLKPTFIRAELYVFYPETHFMHFPSHRPILCSCGLVQLVSPTDTTSTMLLIQKTTASRSSWRGPCSSWTLHKTLKLCSNYSLLGLETPGDNSVWQYNSLKCAMEKSSVHVTDTVFSTHAIQTQ